MFDAYKVAVKLTLVNHASAGLAAISADLLSASRHANGMQGALSGIHGELSKIKRIGMLGGAMAGLGFGGLALLKGPLEEAKKFQTEFTRFKSLGFGDAVDDQARTYARAMKTVGTSTTENMALVSDAMAVFKNLHHAEFAAPIMAKMKFANSAVFGGESGSQSESKFMDMLKVIEFRGGLSSQNEFETQANFVQKVISGSRNRVDATQLLNALKTGGVALSQRSNKDFYLGAEPLIQEFGGQRYGTGAMSIYQNLVQARGSMASQNELLRLGLLDPKMVKQNPHTGKMQKVAPGAFLGSAILEKEGELALLEKVLLPAFKKKGVTGDEAVIREIGMILGNRTGSSLLSRIYQQRASIHTQSSANASAMDINQLAGAADQTLAGKEIALHANWKKLLLELGDVILPMAIKAVQGVSSALLSLTNFAKENPRTIKLLVGAFVTLSATLAFSGSVLMLSAAFRGLSLALTFGAAGGAGGIAQIASGLGLVGGALTKLGAAGLAFGVGWTLGTILYDTLIAGTKFSDWLGSVIAHLMSPFSKDASDAVRKNSGKEWYEFGPRLTGLGPAPKQKAAPYYPPGFVPPKTAVSHVPPPQMAGNSKGHGDVYLDGRKVGSVLMPHLTKEMSRQPTGPRGVDPSAGMFPVTASLGY